MDSNGSITDVPHTSRFLPITQTITGVLGQAGRKAESIIEQGLRHNETCAK